jgi:hypothetical protein
MAFTKDIGSARTRTRLKAASAKVKRNNPRVAATSTDRLRGRVATKGSSGHINFLERKLERQFPGIKDSKTFVQGRVKKKSGVRKAGKSVATRKQTPADRKFAQQSAVRTSNKAHTAKTGLGRAKSPRVVGRALGALAPALELTRIVKKEVARSKKKKPVSRPKKSKK